jgi:arabinosaccharide transport system permease protein
MVGYIYDKGFQQGLLGMGSAIGIVLFIIVFSLSLILLKSFGFFDTEDAR